MSVYTYSDSKIVDRITFQTSANGAVRAYLHAAPDASQETLRNITETLQQKELQCIPYTLNGQPTLEVRGFGADWKLLQEMNKHQWIEGKGKHIPDLDKTSFTSKLKKRSLQASGLFYAVGDAAFIGYGWKNGSLLDTLGGIFYALPTPVLLAYGRNDQSQFEVKEYARLMAKHVREVSPTLPEDCSLEAIISDHKKGMFKSANELLQRYPSEFMNINYALAGGCILAAAHKHLKSNHVSSESVDAWKQHLSLKDNNVTQAMAEKKAIKNMRMENWLNVGVGLSTSISGLTATAIREKAHDPDEPRKTGASGVWEWVKGRPLAIAGGGYILSTLMHAASTTVAMKGKDARHKQAVPLRALFVGCSLVAEFLVAISSKGHGEGVVTDRSVDDSVIALAADLIVNQPRARQEYLINYMTPFLGAPNVLAMKDDEVRELLHKQVGKSRQNPWSCENPAPLADTPQAKANAIPAWRAKINAETPVSPQMSV